MKNSTLISSHDGNEINFNGRFAFERKNIFPIKLDYRHSKKEKHQIGKQ